MRFVNGARYQMIYLDQNNQISTRHIKVIHDRGYVLLAYCFEKRGIRTFLKEGILGMTKVSDMREWLPTNNHNEIRHSTSHD